MRALAVIALTLLATLALAVSGGAATDVDPGHPTAVAPTADRVVDHNNTTHDPDEPAAVTAAFSLVTCDGLTCAFDANASQAREGMIEEYRWRFEPGQWRNVSNFQTSYHFSRAGDHNVTLTVVDQEGNTASTSQTITVEAPPDGSRAVPWSALGVGAIAFVASIALARMT